MRGLAMLGLVALLSTCLAGPAGAVGPGEEAPDFPPLQDVLGNSYALADFRGKVVLLALVGYG